LTFKTSQISEQQGLANTRESEVDLLSGRDNRRYGTETAILFKIEEYFNTSTIFDFGVITGTDDANVLKGKSSLFDKELIIADDYRIYRDDDE
jgi:hypothetical protein